MSDTGGYLCLLIIAVMTGISFIFSSVELATMDVADYHETCEIQTVNVNTVYGIWLIEYEFALPNCNSTTGILYTDDRVQLATFTTSKIVNCYSQYPQTCDMTTDMGVAEEWLRVETKVYIFALMMCGAISAITINTLLCVGLRNNRDTPENYKENYKVVNGF